jgi:Asp-tRNA(Asn)/Glu-tRNA(Gln) amidotransferase A subunit family amidase
MGGFPEFERYDGLGLAALVRDRQVSAAEVLEAAVERIDGRDGALNAVIVRLFDDARRRVERGLPDGPFTGVPFLIKDITVQVAGAVTASGSRLFATAVADHDSEIVARYRRAGLVIAGKTNTPELGLATTTEPRQFGPTRNPWSAAHSAGGSSGGAAAAVAAGMVPTAHATDGGGSIRIPASCCGLFGLKPTRARTPAGPMLGEGWSGASIGHAITRTVRDSAALLDAVAGPDVGDPYWAPPPARSFLSEVGAEPGRLRVALCTTPWNGMAVDVECRQAARAAARLCQSLGHIVDEARPEIDVAALGQAQRVIIAGNVRNALETRAAALGRALEPDDVEKMTWLTAQYGREATAADYARSVQVLHRAGRAVGRFFQHWDILLTPTMCNPPHKLGAIDTMTDDPETFQRALFSTIAFTSVFNATGNPAMSVPLHWTNDGLPVGVQFAAPFGEESTLFRLAAQLEAAQPWVDRRPAR